MYMYQCAIHGSYYTQYSDSVVTFGIRSVGVLSTSAHLLHGRSAADVCAAYAAPPSLIRYTNRPSGHQKRNTKRLVTPALYGGRSLDSCESTHVVRRTVGGCVPQLIRAVSRVCD